MYEVDQKQNSYHGVVHHNIAESQRHSLMGFCQSHFLRNQAVFSPGNYAEIFEESQLLASSCALIFLPLDSSHLHVDQVLHLEHERHCIIKNNMSTKYLVMLYILYILIKS